jgi:hypothetical protein
VLEPFMPVNQPGARRVDDRRVISGIVHVLKTGGRWRDCPDAYGPHTTVYNRYNRWSRRGFSGAPMLGRWPGQTGPGEWGSRGKVTGPTSGLGLDLRSRRTPLRAHRFVLSRGAATTTRKGGRIRPAPAHAGHRPVRGGWPQ